MRFQRWIAYSTITVTICNVMFNQFNFVHLYKMRLKVQVIITITFILVLTKALQFAKIMFVNIKSSVMPMRVFMVLALDK